MVHTPSGEATNMNPGQDQGQGKEFVPIIQEASYSLTVIFFPGLK